MSELSARQEDVRRKIRFYADLFGISKDWAEAVGFVESSLGEKQVSPTGCKGVFQMSSVAMKDLLQEMEKKDDDLVDIVCGVAFLRLLLRRHKSIEEATQRFCDPKDREFYLQRVLTYMKEKGEGK